MSTKKTPVSRLLEPRVQEVFLTKHFAVDKIKGFSPQLPAASRTGEARVVVEIPHGLAGLAGPKHPFAAFHTGSKVIGLRVRIHFTLQTLGEGF